MNFCSFLKENQENIKIILYIALSLFMQDYLFIFFYIKKMYPQINNNKEAL